SRLPARSAARAPPRSPMALRANIQAKCVSPRSLAARAKRLLQVIARRPADRRALFVWLKNVPLLARRLSFRRRRRLAQPLIQRSGIVAGIERAVDDEAWRALNLRLSRGIGIVLQQLHDRGIAHIAPHARNVDAGALGERIDLLALERTARPHQ